MHETAGYEIIGNDAELACFRIYHGDSPANIKEMAKDRVIKSNLRFVLKFAIDYHRITGLPIADFFSEGKLGLMEAFYKFNPDAGVKFGSYAVWYIRTCMSRVVNERDLIRVPVRLRKKVLNAMRAGRGTESIKYGQAAEQAIMGVSSMDMPVTGDDYDDGSPSISGTLVYDDQASPEEDYAAGAVNARLGAVCSRELSADERNVIHAAFGIDTKETSLADIACEAGTSKEWARRVKTRALNKLRDARGLAKLRGLV